MEYLKNTFGYYFFSNNNTTLKSESKIQNNPDCKIDSIKDYNNVKYNNNKFDIQQFDNSILSTINSILFYKKNISTSNHNSNNSSDDECDDNCECKN